LVSFSLERVPVFHLQHVDWGVLAPHDPQMKRWVELMAHHGGVPTVTYGHVFFQWLRDQLVMIEDYAYVETDFHGNPDLALPKGSQWGEIGKNDFSLYVVFGILIIIFLCYVSETNQELSIMQM
jgi:hypothetical protein